MIPKYIRYPSFRKDARDFRNGRQSSFCNHHNKYFVIEVTRVSSSEPSSVMGCRSGRAAQSKAYQIVLAEVADTIPPT
jgi:hypothetical protein